MRGAKGSGRMGTTLHWWKRTAREQKRIRRWAAEPLRTNRKRQAEKRLARIHSMEAARLELRKRMQCVCEGKGQMMRGTEQDSGRMEWVTVPCPHCGEGGV